MLKKYFLFIIVLIINCKLVYVSLVQLENDRTIRQNKNSILELVGKNYANVEIIETALSPQPNREQCVNAIRALNEIYFFKEFLSRSERLFIEDHNESHIYKDLIDQCKEKMNRVFNFITEKPFKNDFQNFLGNIFLGNYDKECSIIRNRVEKVKDIELFMLGLKLYQDFYKEKFTVESYCSLNIKVNRIIQHFIDNIYGNELETKNYLYNINKHLIL